MTTDFRALCVELSDALRNAIRVVYHEDGTQHISTAMPILRRARAALADEPAVPEGREPASVTGQPSDDELLRLYGVATPCHTVHEWERELNFARAVLARWGNPAPQPPAEGEVAELVAWLREQADHELGSTFDADYFSEDPAARNLNRAAELLTRARAALADEPAAGEPVSVSGQPDDEQLLSLEQLRKTWNAQADAANNWDALGHDEIVLWAQRQALARWGNPAPQPPAEGEVEELVAWLRSNALTVKKASGNPANGARQRMNRAADLLQRLSPPQPVPVSERLPGPGEMTEDGEVWVDDPGHDYPIADSGDYDWEPHKWIMRPISRFDAKYGRRWLPAHALPVPGAY